MILVRFTFIFCKPFIYKGNITFNLLLCRRFNRLVALILLASYILTNIFFRVFVCSRYILLHFIVERSN